MNRITKYAVALLSIVLMGLLFRVYHLGTQSIWLDEAFSVWISKLSVRSIVAVTAADVHPPLYYFLLHYWIIIFGTSESAVRLLSVLFGVLAIPMIYFVGRQLFNKEVGLVGALILALSSFNIYYSQETRMYSLMVLLALLSMYFFWRFLQQSNLVSSVGYVLSTTLLVYTHYYGWFVIIAQNIYVVSLLLLSKNRTYKLKHWVALQAIVVVLYVPWMAVLVKIGRPLQGVGASLTLPEPATFIDTFSRYSGTGVLSVLFLGLSVLALFAYQKVRGSMDWKAPLKALQSYAWEVRIANVERVYFLAVWLFTINIVPFIISRLATPIYDSSYTIAASLALYLLVARGIGNINSRYTKPAVICIIVVLSVANLQMFYTSSTKQLVGGGEATKLIDANLKSGDVVLVSPDWQGLVFDYYHDNRTDVAVTYISSWAVTPTDNRSEDKIAEIQSDVHGHDRVWLFFGYTGPTKSSSAAEQELAKNFTLSILNESYTNIYKMSYQSYEVLLFQKRA